MVKWVQELVLNAYEDIVPTNACEYSLFNSFIFNYLFIYKFIEKMLKAYEI